MLKKGLWLLFSLFLVFQSCFASLATSRLYVQEYEDARYTRTYTLKPLEWVSCTSIDPPSNLRRCIKRQWESQIEKLREYRSESPSEISDYYPFSVSFTKYDWKALAKEYGAFLEGQPLWGASLPRKLLYRGFLRDFFRINPKVESEIASCALYVDLLAKGEDLPKARSLMKSLLKLVDLELLLKAALDGALTNLYLLMPLTSEMKARSITTLIADQRVEEKLLHELGFEWNIYCFKLAIQHGRVYTAIGMLQKSEDMFWDDFTDADLAGLSYWRTAPAKARVLYDYALNLLLVKRCFTTLLSHFEEAIDIGNVVLIESLAFMARNEVLKDKVQDVVSDGLIHAAGNGFMLDVLASRFEIEWTQDMVERLFTDLSYNEIEQFKSRGFRLDLITPIPKKSARSRRKVKDSEGRSVQQPLVKNETRT